MAGSESAPHYVVVPPPTGYQPDTGSGKRLGVGVVSTHPSLGGVCDGSRSQAAAWSAETMATKGPRELASSRWSVGPFGCWSPTNDVNPDKHGWGNPAL